MFHLRKCENTQQVFMLNLFVSALVSILVFSSLIADYQASEQHYYDTRDSREYRSQGRGNYSRGKEFCLIYID
jgi:hypothetical protein